MKSKLLKNSLMALSMGAVITLTSSCQIDDQQAIEGPTQVEKKQAIGPANLTARIAEGADEVFDITEVQPVPPGGMEGWKSYLMSNLRYPKSAKESGVEGTVIVVFVINADGSIRDPEILRGIGAGADEEALRVVMESPKWTPAYQKGKAVASRLRLPVRFSLGDANMNIVEIQDGKSSQVSEIQVVSKK